MIKSLMIWSISAISQQEVDEYFKRYSIMLDVSERSFPRLALLRHDVNRFILFIRFLSPFRTNLSGTSSPITSELENSTRLQTRIPLMVCINYVTQAETVFWIGINENPIFMVILFWRSERMIKTKCSFFLVFGIT